MPQILFEVAAGQVWQKGSKTIAVQSVTGLRVAWTEGGEPRTGGLLRLKARLLLGGWKRV